MRLSRNVNTLWCWISGYFHNVLVSTALNQFVGLTRLGPFMATYESKVCEIGLSPHFPIERRNKQTCYCWSSK